MTFVISTFNSLFSANFIQFQWTADFLANFKESADRQTIETRRAFCSQSQLTQKVKWEIFHSFFACRRVIRPLTDSAQHHSVPDHCPAPTWNIVRLPVRLWQLLFALFFPLPAVAEERREEIVGFWNILVHGAWNTRIKTTPGPMIIPGPGDRVTFRHTTFSYFVLFKRTFFSSHFKSINLIQFDFCLNKNLPFYENCSEMI